MAPIVIYVILLQKLWEQSKLLHVIYNFSIGWLYNQITNSPDDIPDDIE